MLKVRLEQTEAALERIVAQMGSVTSRLAMQDLQMGGKVWHTEVYLKAFKFKQKLFQKHCCTTTQEEVNSE